jgi:Tfp pilus assembly major pilin PilA
VSNCARCGNELEPGEIFCRRCGTRLVPGQATRALGADAGREELAMFVGKNTDKYLRKFSKFTENGNTFTATWHWPAFFFTFWWTLYRKMYGWVILAFFLALVPYVHLLSMVGFGISANYLYYRHAQKKLAGLRTAPASEADRAASIGRAGGVNNVAIVLLLLVPILAILAAIAIPQFAMYRQRAADMQAKQEIQEACRIGQKIFSENASKEQIEPDELLYAGLVRTPDVEMTLLDGRRASFSITARHKNGKTFFRTNWQCVLAEERQGEK